MTVLALLTVLAVLQRTLPSAVSAVTAVSVVTANPLKLRPVFALARIQENIFEEVFPEYFAKFLGEFTRCEYMPCLYSHPCEYRKIFLANSQRAQRSKKIQSRSKFPVAIEIFNLARKFQSRGLEFPTKNRAAVGGSLENFILARNFQSRAKSRIFLIFGPSGLFMYCFRDPGVTFDKNQYRHCIKSQSPSLDLSAPSPGDNLRLKLAIRLRGQTVRSDSF